MWAADLVELGVIQESSLEAVLKIFALIREIYEAAYHDTLREREFAVGVLPYLTNIGTTVEIRGVFEDKYRPGQHVSEYKPQLSGVVPISSVRLGLDAGLAKEVAFQADRESLQILIDTLIAAQSDMSVLADAIALKRDDD